MNMVAATPTPNNIVYPDFWWADKQDQETWFELSGVSELDFLNWLTNFHDKDPSYQEQSKAPELSLLLQSGLPWLPPKLLDPRILFFNLKWLAVTEKINQIKEIITHNWYRHADDAFALALLILLWYKWAIKTMWHNDDISQEMLDNPSQLLLDIWLSFDPKNNNLDHHQSKDIKAACILAAEVLMQNSEERNNLISSILESVSRKDVHAWNLEEWMKTSELIRPDTPIERLCKLLPLAYDGKDEIKKVNTTILSACIYYIKCLLLWKEYLDELENYLNKTIETAEKKLKNKKDKFTAGYHASIWNTDIHVVDSSSNMSMWSFELLQNYFKDEVFIPEEQYIYTQSDTIHSIKKTPRKKIVISGSENWTRTVFSNDWKISLIEPNNPPEPPILYKHESWRFARISCLSIAHIIAQKTAENYQKAA